MNPNNMSIQSILELLNVSKVVCIDDTYSSDVTVNAVMQRILTFIADGSIEKHQDLFRAKLTGTPPDVLEEQLMREVDSLSPLELEHIYNELGKGRSVVHPDDEVNVQDKQVATFLSSLLKPILGENFHEVTPTQWLQESDTILGQVTPNGRCMLLFDYEIKFRENSGEGARELTGVDLIQKVLESQNHNKDVICVLYSHKFTADQERPQAVEFLTELKAPLNRWLLLSKSRLNDEDPSKFAEGLKELALNFVSQQLLHEVFELRQSADSRAYKHLSGWRSYSLHTVVITSSEHEGVWHANTLRRIFDAVRAKELKMLTHGKRTEINRLVELIKHLENGSSTRSDASNTEILEIRALEMFETSDALNKFHDPLQLGDIFETVGDAKYILLAQPCDLMVRKNRLTRVYLVPVMNGKPNENQKDTTSIFDYADGREHYLHFKKAMLLPTLVLDLAVFQQDGSCSICLDQVPPTGIVQEWGKRYEEISKELRELALNLNLVGQSDLQAEHKERLKGALLSTYRVGQELPRFSNGTFVFPFKRISRLREPWASQYIREFMDFSGRFAFEHDYAIGITEQQVATGQGPN